MTEGSFKIVHFETPHLQTEDLWCRYLWAQSGSNVQLGTCCWEKGRSGALNDVDCGMTSKSRSLLGKWRRWLLVVVHGKCLHNLGLLLVVLCTLGQKMIFFQNTVNIFFQKININKTYLKAFISRKKKY